jgi:hypothetical protein
LRGRLTGGSTSLRRLPLVDFRQRLAEFFPLLEEGGMRRLVPVEFLGLAVAFFGADEVLQGRLTLRD